MANSEQAIIAERSRDYEKNVRECKKELQLLHEHHPEQWRRNLIEINEERHRHAHGIDINGTSRSFARSLESRSMEIRSTGDGTAI